MCIRDSFKADFFWQPTAFSKRLVDGEDFALRAVATDPDAWREATRTARAGLPPETVDLSTVWDRTDKPVMYDFVHSNELGARVVAEAIYRRLKPQLEEAAGR